MRSKASVVTSFLAISCVALALPATAAPESHLPAAHKEGAITYLSGGVGNEEADAIKHAASNYPLELEFLAKAKPKDEYLADIEVRIKDAHDKTLVNTTSNGPFLLAKLPDGKYTVSAERNGKTENRTIEIATKEHRRVVFEWAKISSDPSPTKS